MGQFVALKTDGKLNQALAGLLGDLLRKEVVAGVTAPTRQRHHGVVMQTLITDPEALSQIDPFAPVVTTNAAKQVSALTFKPIGRPLAALLRSCEVRAFIELVKLNQGSVDDLLLIGLDCLGRYESRDYLGLAEQSEDPAAAFLDAGLNGGDTRTAKGFDLTDACKACLHPVPDNVDIRLCVIGADPAEQIWLEAVTDKGLEALKAAGMECSSEAPAGRAEAVASLEQRRAAFREEHFAAFRERTRDLDGVAEAMSSCINCYNCRVACPVCYCRECVFVTDTFRHDSEVYLRWADKRGKVKLPTDTVFYHLTRMIHISTLCVGCGQCTSACPNDLPVMELIATTADQTQARFDYTPGRSLEEGQPLAIFHAEEFDDVTGQVK